MSESKIKFEACPRYRQYQAIRTGLKARHGDTTAVLHTNPPNTRYEPPGYPPPPTVVAADEATRNGILSATMHSKPAWRSLRSCGACNTPRRLCLTIAVRAAAVVIESQGGRVPQGLAATYLAAFDRASLGAPLSGVAASSDATSIDAYLAAAAGGVPPSELHAAAPPAQKRSFASATAGGGGALDPCISTAASEPERDESHTRFFASDVLRFSAAIAPRITGTKVRRTDATPTALDGADSRASAEVPGGPAVQPPGSVAPGPAAGEGALGGDPLRSFSGDGGDGVDDDLFAGLLRTTYGDIRGDLSRDLFFDVEGPFAPSLAGLGDRLPDWGSGAASRDPPPARDAPVTASTTPELDTAPVSSAALVFTRTCIGDADPSLCSPG